MSDLIKKIKIKKQDDTYTDYIPIGAEAKIVDCSDGESVEYKLNKKPYYYNNVADMKADTKLKVGDMAITLGYYEANDGGRAEYKIVKTSDKYIEELENNLKAELVIKNNAINVDQLGAKGDGIVNDYNVFKKCFDFANLKKYDIMLSPKTYNLVGNRLILKTNLYGNNCVIISNDNISEINLDEPLIHIVSDNNFTSTETDNCYIFRTYPEHDNIWKRSGNTEAAALGTVPKECNVKIKTKLLYDYFFNFSNPVEEYRKIDSYNIIVKDLIINKTIVKNSRTSYIKRNILIERDNVILDNIKFNITDTLNSSTPYLGLIKLNKCYNVQLNNCIIPALLTNSSYAFHTSYDIKTVVNNCYINGEYECWGGTSSNGTIDITYSKCNVNRIDAHEGFFGLTVKDCFIGKEGIVLTGGKYANIERCYFDSRRCISFREDYGSGFNGTVRLKNCNGIVSNAEIIYLQSITNFDYGYNWKHPIIEIEDCEINANSGIIDIFSYNVNNNTNLSWYSLRNTLKVNNFVSNRNFRLFKTLPLIFGDFEIQIDNLYLRSGIYNTIQTGNTNTTMYINANKSTIRYADSNSTIRIYGNYIDCEMLNLNFIHLNTALFNCKLAERDNITCGYNNSGKRLSYVNFGLLIPESSVTVWHENSYNFKTQ